MSFAVLLVDSQPLFRIGIRRMLADTEFFVEQESASLATATRICMQREYPVIICSVQLIDGNGMALMESESLDLTRTGVLFLTDIDNPHFTARAMNSKAGGLLQKTVTSTVLLKTLRTIAAGEKCWSRSDSRRVTGAMATPRVNAGVDVPLTRREFEVLTRLCDGNTNKRIAESLEISYETVKEHVQHLLRKIGVADRTQAAVWAVRKGLV